MDSFWTVLVAAIGFGAGGEAIRRYRGFKSGRASLPYAARNSGFWTDRRIIRAEALLVTMLLAGPWTIIIMAVATNNSLLPNIAAVISYPFAIWLFMRGLRAEQI